ncbi:MAG: glycosyl hydrolase family 18 protein [Myxococcota bacterium]
MLLTLALALPAAAGTVTAAAHPDVPMLRADAAYPGPHAQQVAELGAEADAHPALPVPPRGPLPVPTPGPDLRVYGYLAYWDNDLASVPWDDITDLAIFSAGANSDGTLYDTWKWDLADDAVIMAAPYGVRVHLCVTNFDPTSLQTLLSSTTNRNELIAELVDWQATTGAHGVNIDFEGLPYAVKSQMVTFTRDLEAAVGEVVLATPSVDWAGSWDYDQLGLYADLFIMGYGYHWGGSSYAGPTDPLYAGAGTVWSGVQSYSLATTVADYTDPSYGADPSRVILGLPLYGMSWATSNNNVPTATLGTGSTAFFSDAWDDAATYGRSWESTSHTPYTYGGGRQIWYGDEESVRDRISYVRDQTSIAGIGFWALHYDGDDPSFWSMIHTETTFASTGTTDTTGTTATDTTSGTSGTSGTTGTDGTDGTDGTTPGGPPPAWQADAGLPFLAYVGDTVVLSGTGSRGPAGAQLSYEWTQLSGPAVTLSSTTDAEPTFQVEHPGTHVFELRVGDGTTWSAPARSYLVVIDPDLPNRHARGCGCDGALPAGSAGTFGVGLAGLALLRRRRRR